jgi:hypothetical protein
LTVVTPFFLDFPDLVPAVRMVTWWPRAAMQRAVSTMMRSAPRRTSGQE